MYYRHSKSGNIYLKFFEATDEKSLLPVVIYRGEDGKMWSRPKAEFEQMVLIDGVEKPRFERLSELEVFRERISSGTGKLVSREEVLWLFDQAVGGA